MPHSPGQASGATSLPTLCCQGQIWARDRQGEHGRRQTAGGAGRCRTQTQCRHHCECGHSHDSRWLQMWTQAGWGGTHILHALNVSLNLLQHAGTSLCLLGTPHTLVDAFSHLLDVPLCIQQEWVVWVVLRRVLQEVLGWEWGSDLWLAAPASRWGPTLNCWNRRDCEWTPKRTSVST